MDDSDTDRHDSSKNQEWAAFRRGLVWFVVLGAIIWAAMFALYRKLPFLQSGSEIVAAAKVSYSLAHPIFDNDSRVRILVFGDSKTLAAFNPRVFDAHLAEEGIEGKVQSFNAGLPGEKRFVVYLERLLASGTRPTHVLIQFSPIREDHEFRWSEWLRHDKMIVDTLFPFRTLPRDLTLFLFSAIGHGGVSKLYGENEWTADQVIRDRGYFFIKGQSHFPGDSLPDDFRLATDTPAATVARPIDPSLDAFARLSSLAMRYGFKVIFVPAVYRTGELAPPAARAPAVASLPGSPQFLISGEDYWLMPSRYFSDPIHANTGGAEIYSARLAALLACVLRQNER